MRARISRGSRRLAMQSSRASDGSMRRVMVVGCAGAGKTTLARSLAARLRLPLIHLDFHFWRAGWQLPDSKDWREKGISRAGGPQGGMDGEYFNTYQILKPPAATLVFPHFCPPPCVRPVLLAPPSRSARPPPP